jgi:hypothetical protein
MHHFSSSSHSHNSFNPINRRECDTRCKQIPPQLQLSRITISRATAPTSYTDLRPTGWIKGHLCATPQQAHVALDPAKQAHSIARALRQPNCHLPLPTSIEHAFIHGWNGLSHTVNLPSLSKGGRCFSTMHMVELTVCDGASIRTRVFAGNRLR